MKSEIRKDYIQERYVIISPRRQARPTDVKEKKSEAQIRRGNDICPFCPLHKEHKREGLYCVSQKGDAGVQACEDWKVKVILNKFPAVTLDNEKAYGVQEVVIETPKHGVELYELSEDHIADIFQTYAAQTKEIAKNEKIEYVIIFKNQGGKAGASLEHAHSQIFATDFIPPHLIDKSQRVQRYKLEHGTCVYCDVIKKEQEGPRLVYRDDFLIAFCPYAPAHNYELWIMPILHLDNITLLSLEERMAWAHASKKFLPKIHELGLDYNYYFHQVVNDEDQHFYMKITPRGSIWAGVEIGSGVVINPVSPEDAAQYYRGEA